MVVILEYIPWWQRQNLSEQIGGVRIALVIIILSIDKSRPLSSCLNWGNKENPRTPCLNEDQSSYGLRGTQLRLVSWLGSVITDTPDDWDQTWRIEDHYRNFEYCRYNSSFASFLNTCWLTQRWYVGWCLEVRYRVKALLRKVEQGFTSSKIRSLFRSILRDRLIAAELDSFSNHDDFGARFLSFGA